MVEQIRDRADRSFRNPTVMLFRTRHRIEITADA